MDSLQNSIHHIIILYQRLLNIVLIVDLFKFVNFVCECLRNNSKTQTKNSCKRQAMHTNEQTSAALKRGAAAAAKQVCHTILYLSVHHTHARHLQLRQHNSIMSELCASSVNVT